MQRSHRDSLTRDESEYRDQTAPDQYPITLEQFKAGVNRDLHDIAKEAKDCAHTIAVTTGAVATAEFVGACVATIESHASATLASAAEKANDLSAAAFLALFSAWTKNCEENLEADAGKAAKVAEAAMAAEDAAWHLVEETDHAAVAAKFKPPAA